MRPKLPVLNGERGPASPSSACSFCFYLHLSVAKALPLTPADSGPTMSTGTAPSAVDQHGYGRAVDRGATLLHPAQNGSWISRSPTPRSASTQCCSATEAAAGPGCRPGAPSRSGCIARSIRSTGRCASSRPPAWSASSTSPDAARRT